MKITEVVGEMDSEEVKKEGEIDMNACAVKPTLPFVTRNKLERTPASEGTNKMVEFMDSHNFSFSIDKKTGVLYSKVEKK